MTLDDFSDRLNPVFVKETRQLFHNKTVLTTLLLLLVAELFMHLIIALNYSSMDKRTLEDLGMISFVIQQVMVGLAILVICIGRAPMIFTQERSAKELDYSRISVISPRAIVIGKVISQVVVMLDIYTIAMPFMFIAYFLRGVSIPQMVGWSMGIIPIYVLFIQFGLMLASFGKKNLLGVIFVFSYFGAQALVPIGIGFGSGHLGGDAVFSIFCYVITFIFASTLLFSLTVAVITSFGNRVYWLRLLGLANLLLLIVLNGALSLCRRKISWYDADDFLAFSSFLILIQFAITVIICLFERDEPGARVMAERPDGRVRRFLRFLLSSGRAGGLAFSWLYLLIWGAAVLAGMLLAPIELFFAGDAIEVASIFYIIAFYLLFYIQFALILVRSFRKLKPEYAGIMVFFLLFVIPFLLASVMCFENGGLGDYWMLLVTTPVCCARSVEIGWLGMLFCLVTLLPLCKYVYASMKRFVFEEKEAK